MVEYGPYIQAARDRVTKALQRGSAPRNPHLDTLIALTDARTGKTTFGDALNQIEAGRRAEENQLFNMVGQLHGMEFQERQFEQSERQFEEGTRRFDVEQQAIQTRFDQRLAFDREKFSADEKHRAYLRAREQAKSGNLPPGYAMMLDQFEEHTGDWNAPERTDFWDKLSQDDRFDAVMDDPFAASRLFMQHYGGAEPSSDSGITRPQAANDAEIDASRQWFMNMDVPAGQSLEEYVTSQTMSNINPVLKNRWETANQHKVGDDPGWDAWQSTIGGEQPVPPRQPGMLERGWQAIFGDEETAPTPVEQPEAVTPQQQTAPSVSSLGTQQNPYRPATEDEFEAIPIGAWFINPANGQPMQKAR